MSPLTGTYVLTSTLGEEVRAFVPAPLPPGAPIDQAPGVPELLMRAERELARLHLASDLVPSPQWFIYGFVRKEAVLTSQIEGTQATLEDLLAHEVQAPNSAQDSPAQEVCNYLEALQFAREQMADPQGLPLSLRLLREAHRRLLRGSRGEDRNPGEFRRSQNWIGGTRPGNATFVPPPPDEMMGCLDAFEKYLYAEDEHPPLIRAGLLHVQFETIHPFLDGNGRVGRLLIALLLEHWGLLGSPLLYISLYFKQHRTEYYDSLSAVRLEGTWDRWIRFFLEGVATIASQATESGRALYALFDADRKRLLDQPKASVWALRLLEALPHHPMLTVAQAMEVLDTTRPTANKTVGFLADQGILRERSGRRRDRTFAYQRYLDLLGEGTGLRE